MANSTGVQISYAKLAQAILIALSVGIGGLLLQQQTAITTLQVQVEFVQKTVNVVSLKMDSHLATHASGGSQE